MKSKGYILFIVYPDGEVTIDPDGRLCKSKQELMERHDIHWDDKWDYFERNEYHYFYLNLSDMRYYPLKKWLNPPNFEDKFKSDTKTEISTKLFSNNLLKEIK